MKRAALAVVAVAVLAAAAVVAGADPEAPATRAAPPATAAVERGDLSAQVSQPGTLTYRGQRDGSPYALINRARGTYTALPDTGGRFACGDVLYRVDERPVLLLCGRVPAYRDLGSGDAGPDVRALNRHLRVRGRVFTSETQAALRRLQARHGVEQTGELDIGAAVFLPGPVRIAEVTADLGGPARPGARLAEATSGALEVQVRLDASQQGQVRRGDRARVTLPGNRSITGAVARIGTVAQAPSGDDAGPGDATLPVHIALERPAKARGLDRAPVGVEITTRGLPDALSVPVTAVVGRAGGGFAVEVVRRDGRRELVAVELGLFDTSAGRVQVDGDLVAGDRVVVPSP